MSDDFDFTKKEKYLIEEYNSAVQLTFHIDSLRNKLTSFYMSFAGLAIAGLLFMLEKKSIIIDSNVSSKLIAFLLLIISLMGHIFVCVLAKIRKVQLEHFRIINNIRSYFVKDDINLKNVIQLSSDTLPKVTFTSGTYFWLLIILVLNSVIIAVSIDLFIFQDLSKILECAGIWIFIGIFFISFISQNIMYRKYAQLGDPIVYKNEKE